MDAPGICLQQVVDQCLYPRLCIRWKVTLHVDFPDSISKSKVGVIHAALPSWTLFRDAVECLSHKIEALVDQGLRQEIARVFDGMKSQPGFPCIERFACGKSGEAGYSLRVPDDEFRSIVQSGCVEQSRPIESRRF